MSSTEIETIMQEVMDSENIFDEAQNMDDVFVAAVKLA